MGTTAMVLSGATKQDITYEKCVGKGSCAVVHLATWQRKHVAVKVVQNTGMKMAHAIDAETKVLSLFSAQRKPDAPIIQMFDVQHQPTYSVMVLEFAPLGNLFDALHADTATHILRHANKLHIFQNVARGVSLLHKFGWVHGDVKLENVLLFPEKDAPRAKLCDFSHAFRPGREQMVFGKGYGTLDYMAPEAVRVKRGDITAFVSFPADVWAMGIMAWEMFISGKGGQPLFCRKGVEETLDAIMHFPIPKQAFCSSDVATLLFSGQSGMLQRDVSQRITAEQVCVDLNGVAKNKKFAQADFSSI